MNIFLLEDNLIFIKEFKKFASKSWHNLHICHDIDEFEFKECDVYLVDLQIWNNLYSYDVIRKIRKQTDKEIVLFTHHEDPDLITHWLEAWADDYIYKFQYQLYWVRLKILEHRLRKLWKRNTKI